MEINAKSYKQRPMWVPKTVDPERPVSEYIREWADFTPDSIAIGFYGRDITYGELNKLIDKAANGLIALGVKKGDRVGIMMDNCPQFAIAYFGATRAGAGVVGVNPMFKEFELIHEFNDSGMKALFCLDHLYWEVEKARDRTKVEHIIVSRVSDFLPDKPAFAVPEEKHPAWPIPNTISLLEFLDKYPDTPVCKVRNLKKDLALLQYTGGTTGTPKGAALNHYAISIATIASAYWYHHREDDVHACFAPFFHIMGQQQGLCCGLASGGTIVPLTRFVPDTAARAMHHYRCSAGVFATTMMIALLALPNIKEFDFTNFRMVVTGGSAVSTELQNQFKVMFPNASLGEGYGLSETMPQGGCATPFYRYKPGFVGVPQINEIKIFDPENRDQELPANTEGEIAIKGPCMMEGYWGHPEETKEVFHNGWFFTADLGLKDEDGFVKFLGRNRELMKCSGFSVFPTEVEDLIYKHPCVKEVAVIGIPDEYRGESPKAFVILKPEWVGKITEKELLDWSKDHMAAYKRPKLYVFVEDLPRSGAGKALKRKLS